MGWLEESRVEEIAVFSWRLRRLLRWESGMTARALATNSYNLQESKTSSLEEPEAVPSSSPEMDAITDHLFLPSNEELDKLVRYEALLNRQLNHAIAELERLQTRRKEGSTPANVGNIAKQSQETLWYPQYHGLVLAKQSQTVGAIAARTGRSELANGGPPSPASG